MSQIFQSLKVALDDDLDQIVEKLVPRNGGYRILRQSVDARRRHSPHFIYTVEVFDEGEEPQDDLKTPTPANYQGSPVLIVGAGPAGLFAALNLLEQGVPCHLFDRGGTTHERIKAIAKFWKKGELNPDNNVCFGEGGAGLFSDGKLITRIKSPHIPFVLDRLIQFGAPKQIRYYANPHVGSDRIRRLLPVMRQRLLDLGGKVHLNARVNEIYFDGNKVAGLKTADGQEFFGEHLILATGHSAEEVFSHLKDSGVDLEGKSFALGLRVEHSQELIDKIQYRAAAGHPKLGAANYRLTYHDHDEDQGVYSFCMCPGGYVLSCSTTPGQVVSNGMSNYHRNSPYANAAIVASINHDKLFGANQPFAGLEFRQKIEKMAFNAVQEAGGTKQLPAQRIEDFFQSKLSELPKSSCPSGLTATDLNQVLPDFVASYLKNGIEQFDHSMKGFKTNDALVIGVETRTSCPIRVPRDKQTLQSTSHHGLYPTGEGAGYAGGITSAACDGVRVSEAILDLYR